jgi:hypothetical protein
MYEIVNAILALAKRLLYTVNYVITQISKRPVEKVSKLCKSFYLVNMLLKKL